MGQGISYSGQVLISVVAVLPGSVSSIGDVGQRANRVVLIVGWLAFRVDLLRQQTFAVKGELRYVSGAVCPAGQVIQIVEGLDDVSAKTVVIGQQISVIVVAERLCLQIGVIDRCYPVQRIEGVIAAIPSAVDYGSPVIVAVVFVTTDRLSSAGYAGDATERIINFDSWVASSIGCCNGLSACIIAVDIG